MRPIYVVMVMILFSWIIFAYALTRSFYSFGELSIPQGLLWLAPFRNLQEEVNEDIQSRACDLGIFLSHEIWELFLSVVILAIGV